MAIVNGPLQLFVSYAHEDDELRAELDKHLVLLRKQGLISAWHDRDISAGLDWKGQIDEHLESAHIILLLVSSDFIASGYCYDIEMKRALERQALGDARVIPIILRPVDLTGVPFASLQSLPRDAKPVTLWSNRDNAFRDIALGLRKTVEELHGDVPLAVASGWAAAARRRRPATIAAAIVLALATAGMVPWLRAQDHYIRQGEEYLNIGRHEEARDAFRRALSANPWNQSASWGIEKASVAELSDPVAFERSVRNGLYVRKPHDPHVNVYMGDLAASEGDLRSAIKYYETALAAQPDLAEAYFKLGVLNDQSGDMLKAEQMYQEAIKRSKTTPRYRNNLAYLYTKKGPQWYDRAIEEYGRNTRYPLSALEAATLSWFKGRLSQGRDLQLQAVQWLDDDAIAALPENRGPWYFEVGTEGIEVVTRAEKQCLAYLALSASVFMEGERNRALGYADRARSLCSARFGSIRDVVEFDLGRLAREQPLLAQPAAEFSGDVLATKGVQR